MLTDEAATEASSRLMEAPDGSRSEGSVSAVKCSTGRRAFRGPQPERMGLFLVRHAI